MFWKKKKKQAETIQEFFNKAKELLIEYGYNTDTTLFVSCECKQYDHVPSKLTTHYNISVFIPSCWTTVNNPSTTAAIEQLRIELTKRKLDKPQVQNDIEI